MNLERFISEGSPRWAELEALLSRNDTARGRVSPTDFRRAATLYRQASADLAVARRQYPLEAGTERLGALVARGHGLVYGRAGAIVGFVEFFTRRFWVLVASYGPLLGISALLTFGPAALGFIWAWADPAGAAGFLPAGYHATAHPGQHGIVGVAIGARVGIAFMIFINNILVSIIAMAGGFTFGLVTAYVLVQNGTMLGVLFSLEIRAGGWEGFVRLVVPHGLLELSCITLAGAIGLSITRAMIDPGRLTRGQALQALGPSAALTMLGIMAGLVVAGCVEGIVTTWDLPLWLALAVGFFLGGGFWTLVVVRGVRGIRSSPFV